MLPWIHFYVWSMPITMLFNGIERRLSSVWKMPMCRSNGRRREGNRERWWRDCRLDERWNYVSPWLIRTTFETWSVKCWHFSARVNQNSKRIAPRTCSWRWNGKIEHSSSSIPHAERLVSPHRSVGMSIKWSKFSPRSERRRFFLDGSMRLIVSGRK